VERFCRIVFITFAGLYAVALALFVIGTFGFFGSERGPLAGIFLIPLGLPWSLMLDAFSAPALPWLAASAPAANLLFLWGVYRLAGLNNSRHR
jgi:hypothetical protein